MSQERLSSISSNITPASGSDPPQATKTTAKSSAIESDVMETESVRLAPT